jgi:hypothetical protein
MKTGSEYVWSDKDKERLELWWNSDQSIEWIAEQLGRTVNAIRNRASIMGLGIRQPAPADKPNHGRHKLAPITVGKGVHHSAERGVLTPPESSSGVGADSSRPLPSAEARPCTCPESDGRGDCIPPLFLTNDAGSDPELVAMQIMFVTLSHLTPEQQERAIEWTYAKLGIGKIKAA